MNRWLDLASRPVLLSLLITACSGAPAADADTAATAGDDTAVFAFGDAPAGDADDASLADAAPGEDAVQTADSEGDASDGPDSAAADSADAVPDAGCTTGSCAASSFPCTVSVCQPDGKCAITGAADGTVCSDDNACTDKDACADGACQGQALNCDDGNACTLESCKPSVGCITTFQIAPCEDGDGCTVNDQCVSGACTPGAPMVCTTSDPCQQAGACEPATGVCSVGSLPNGAACGGGKVCMVGKCSAADVMPSGALAWFNTANCPPGWLVEPLAEGRTLVPSNIADAGQTDGGALAPGEDRTHSHAVIGSIVSSAVSFVGIVGCCNAGLSSVGTWDVTGSALPASSGIPYVQLRACRKTTAIPYGDAPQGLVIFLAGLSCPTGWASDTTGLNRYPVGTPAGGSTGATFGATSSHSHSVATTVSLPSHGVGLASGCCGGGFAAAGALDFKATTTAATPVFPALRHIACASSAPSGTLGPVPSGLVSFFASATCPAGWSIATFAQGRLIVGAAADGDVGQTVGKALADQEDRGHSHGLLLSVQPPSKSIAGANGGNGQGADSGKVDATGKTGSATSGMAFIQWLTCEKD